MSKGNRISSIFDEIPVSDFDELALRSTKVLSPVEREPVWRFVQSLYNRKNKFTRPDPKYRLMACMLNAILHEKKPVFLMSTFIMEKLYEKDENIKAKSFHSANFNAMILHSAV